MRYASIGSVSHGTLKTEDLLGTFSDALESAFTLNLCDLDKEPLQRREGLQRLVWDAREMLDIPEDERGAVWEMSADTILSELIEALSEFSPPYCYFGAHPGDGSDFGFWPCMEQIEELPRVESSDEARKLGEDCVYVNDHGNVTVYSGDGSVILELV